MTTAARLVLSDCRYALSDFSSEITGARWRVTYMANVALLRTVYHALKNRDVPRDERLKGAFKSWDAALGSTKPEPAIYWSFIVDERNLLLKEYEGSPVNPTQTHEIQFDLSTGKTKNLGLVRQAYVYAEGPFQGQDQRILIKQAIIWWEAQLSHLECASAA